MEKEWSKTFEQNGLSQKPRKTEVQEARCDQSQVQQERSSQGEKTKKSLLYLMSQSELVILVEQCQ